MTARNRKAGFTLVEILIVVVILGILAAIVIPQFSSASESAKASSLISQLQTVRSQLELFQVQHGGNYPTAMVAGGSASDAPTWQPMTDDHDWDATNGFVYTGDSFGPYLQKYPSNPFARENGAFNVVASHWEYNATTGAIRGVVDGLTTDKVSDLGLDDSTDFVQPTS